MQIWIIAMAQLCLTPKILQQSAGDSSLKKVGRAAIVGGGAAGLITAHVLRKAGIDVCIFEQSNEIGGVWYCDKSKASPMYKSLRTNLPSEIMSINYLNPFVIDSKDRSNNDLTSYATYEEVQSYLQKFKASHELMSLIRLHARVIKVSKCNEEWTVEWYENDEVKAADYDAVVVCNGHFAIPFIPKVRGLEVFKGESIHSIHYEELRGNPSKLTGKRVLVVGSKSSGTDTAREIVQTNLAAEVRISDRNIQSRSYFLSFPDGRSLSPEEIASTSSSSVDSAVLGFHPAISHIGEEVISFEDGSSFAADLILWCTGYSYDYPFLSTEGVEDGDPPSSSSLNSSTQREPFAVKIENGKRLRGLYRQLVHQLEPSLAFVGLPFSVVPFPLFFVQATYLAALYTVPSNDWSSVSFLIRRLVDA